jgi:hypothetical protein
MVAAASGDPSNGPRNRIKAVVHEVFGEPARQDHKIPDDAPAPGTTEGEKVPDAARNYDLDSMTKLSMAANSSHWHYRISLERANEAALRTGELLAAVRKWLGPAKWLNWCGMGLNMTRRQAKRYVRLHRSRTQLNLLNLHWIREWTMTEALDRLAEAQPAKETEPPQPDLSAHPSADPAECQPPSLSQGDDEAGRRHDGEERPRKPGA